MAKYYAYDMPNGLTYIGTPDFDSLETSIILKEAFVVKTKLTLTEPKERNAYYLNPKRIYLQLYTSHVYRAESLRKDIFDECLLPKSGVGSAIAAWYLGEDIREQAKSEKEQKR